MIVLMTKTTKGFNEILKRTMLFESGKSFEVPEKLGQTLIDSGAAVYSAIGRDTQFYFRDTRKNVDGYRPLTKAEWEQRQ